MKSFIVLSALSVTLVACTQGDARDTTLANEGKSSANVNNDRGIFRPASATLAASTSVPATMSQQLHSRTNKPNEIIKASVSSDVKDANGRVAIPAGSVITMRIDKLEPSSVQVGPNGRLMLEVVSVNVRGKEVPISGTVGPIPHTMQGRGITTDEAARVAGGAAVGAIIGQAIGKNTKSTVIGGAVGTAAGAATAAKYAMKDVVVAPGAAFTITLRESVRVTL
jgi:hypothetical protein